MEIKVRITKNEKASKESVLVLASKLGYSLELNRSRIYLVKDDKKLLQKSYRQAYQYLYMKNYRKKRKGCVP